MTTPGEGSARGAVSGHDLGTPLLLDAGNGNGWPAAGCLTETPGVSVDKDLAKLVVERATKFIVRGLLILLWLYLFNSMREYAISYTGGDTRFSTFAAIAVAVPIAEIFCIVGQALVPPPSSSPPIGSSSSMPCNTTDDSEVPTEEVDAVFLDLEKGLTSGYTTVATPPKPVDAMTRAAMETAQDMAAIEAALDVATPRILTCIVRGLLVLLWVYFVDLMRRYIAIQGVGVLLFTMPPLLILAAGVTVFLCLLLECCGQLILAIESLQNGAMLEED